MLAFVEGGRCTNSAAMSRRRTSALTMLQAAREKCCRASFCRGEGGQGGAEPRDPRTHGLSWRMWARNARAAVNEQAGLATTATTRRALLDHSWERERRESGLAIHSFHSLLLGPSGPFLAGWFARGAIVLR